MNKPIKIYPRTHAKIIQAQRKFKAMNEAERIMYLATAEPLVCNASIGKFNGILGGQIVRDKNGTQDYDTPVHALYAATLAKKEFIEAWLAAISLTEATPETEA